MVLRTDAAAHSSPVAHPSEMGPPLSGEQDDLAPPTRVVGTAPLAYRWDLPERVLNTISEARAPSTRRLYALKWSVFSAWCTARCADPLSCDISLTLSFQQELLDKGRTPSTLKVNVAAIAAFHALPHIPTACFSCTICVCISHLLVFLNIQETHCSSFAHDVEIRSIPVFSFLPRGISLCYDSFV